MDAYEELFRVARRFGWKVQLVPYWPKFRPSTVQVGHVLRVVDADGVLLEEHWVGAGVSANAASEWLLRHLPESVA